jgi:hypothetical protein
MQQAVTQLQGLQSSAGSAHCKTASKQLLHSVLTSSSKQWDSFIGANGRSEAASLQLLAAVKPHLALPHPYGSVTATWMAFQILEHLMQHLCSTQQQLQQAAASAVDGPDAQQSRDTNSATPPAGLTAGPQHQLQLLAQLYDCAGLCWQAVVARPTELGLARHVLQYHAAAQACLQLIHRYCTAAGIGQQLQELLVSLLLHGNLLLLQCPAPAQGGQQSAGGLVAIKQEPADVQAADSSQNRSGQQQQDRKRSRLQDSKPQAVLTCAPAPSKQPAVPLLASLKALMRSSKAHAAAAKAAAQRAGNNSNTDSHSSTTPQARAAASSKAATTPGRSPSAATAAAPGELLQAALSAASAARAEELSLSGIQAWGLIGAQLGPRLLDKSVGQPMLDVSMLAAREGGSDERSGAQYASTFMRHVPAFVPDC